MSIENNFGNSTKKIEEIKEVSSEEIENTEIKEAEDLMKELYPELRGLKLSAEDIKSGKIILHVLNSYRQVTSTFPQFYGMFGEEKEKIRRILNEMIKVKMIDERLIEKMKVFGQKETLERISSLLGEYNELVEKKNEKTMEEIYQQTKRIDDKLKEELIGRQRPDFQKNDQGLRKIKKKKLK